MSEEKRFDEWNGFKKGIHSLQQCPKISVGDVWWCAVGENVGVEINGKGHRFSRPVLVLKKLSRYGFMAVPLTSQYHEGNWYVHFDFRGRMQPAVLAQAKVMSALRLYDKMGQLPMSDLELVREGFRALHF